MESTRGKNRWLIAAAAMGVHVSIGSVYAYSVFKQPLLESVGWDPAETAWAFSLAILVLGLSAAFLGPRVERAGPRRSGLAAAVLYGTGLVLAGLGVALAERWLFYLGYGVVGGIGLGVGYIAPVATLVKWFPDRRGLATGLAVMGFGMGALFASPVFAALIAKVGIPATFIGAGIVYGLLMSVSARYLAPPAEGWMPGGATVRAAGLRRAGTDDPVQLSSFEALRTRRFYLLWLMLFINITCGIAVISSASPMGQEIAGLTPATAAAMVGVMGLCNGLGRIGWSSLSDFLGRPGTFAVFCVLQGALFWILPGLSHPLAFQAAVCVIISCYGGGFALMPAFIGDVFGVRQLSAILGNLLTAWAAAGVVGPMLSAYVFERTQSYALSLQLYGCAFAVALVLAFLMGRETGRLRKGKSLRTLSPPACEAA